MKNRAAGKAISGVMPPDQQNDYISLTDLAKYRNSDAPAGVIANWMRNRNTIEFLGLWEELNNPNFNLLEFEEFKYSAGENTFTLSPQKWIASMRDFASVEQFIILVNLESMNADLIRQRLPPQDRIQKL